MNERTANLALVDMQDRYEEARKKLGTKRPVHPAALRAMQARQDRWYALGVVICALCMGAMLAWRG